MYKVKKINRKIDKKVIKILFCRVIEQLKEKLIYKRINS